jgi:hypothetical protein
MAPACITLCPSTLQRLAPEPLAFAVRLIATAAAPSRAPGFPPVSPACYLAPQDPQAARRASGAEPLSLERVLCTPAGSAYWRSDGFRLSALAAAVRAVGRAAEVFSAAAALPELLRPALVALRALGSAGWLPPVRPPGARRRPAPGTALRGTAQHSMAPWHTARGTARHGTAQQKGAWLS